MTQNIKPEDLILEVAEDELETDLQKYEDFMNALCSDRSYQKRAIRKILGFYLVSQYDDIRSLVKENYEKKLELQRSFSDFEELNSQLQFPEKKSCTIDFATGTGKSWVIYGVARIMLCEGVIDKVLVLTPSKTVKRELKQKFKIFTQDKRQRRSLPDGKVTNPRIIDSSQTIQKGDICIDNIHKTYSHTSSSIDDSLKGQGSRTLVINDEAHHLLNPKSHAGRNDKSKMREWEKFLQSERYGFNFILNSTGTPYKGDNYFKNIISRYSLTEAMEAGYVKEINYLEKDESEDWDQKRLAIYQNHQEIKNEYSESDKHITIFVTDAIKRTKEISKELREFLEEQEGISEEEAEYKVIPVSSSNDHQKYVEMLENVDSSDNPVEWIVSVSMLTEGWDVDNVYQIVPHDKRAFNSKLLISQVLGRGLRIPPNYRDPDSKQPEVLIYNHDSWSNKIDNLVREVAEISQTISSSVLEQRSEYNFELEAMDRTKKIQKKIQENDDDGEIELPSSLGFRSESGKREQVYKSAETSDKSARKTDVSDAIKRYSVEEAVNDIYRILKTRDLSQGTDYSERADKEFIEELIRKELKEIGEDTVTEDNLQRAKNAFNVIYKDKDYEQPTIEYEYSDPLSISTSEMSKNKISLRELKNNGVLLYSQKSLDQSPQEEKEEIEEVIGEIKGKFNIRCDEEFYKSPQNITILSHSNEIEFGRRLVRERNSKEIESWVKSPDRGFYSIDYVHRPGTHSLQKAFNPDFILKKDQEILVVEIKSDNDLSLENKDKVEGAEKYFEDLNDAVEQKKYHFYFLTPEDYTNFFEEVIQSGDLNKRFTLQSDLLQKSRSEIRTQG